MDRQATWIIRLGVICLGDGWKIASQSLLLAEALMCLSKPTLKTIRVMVI